MKIVQSVFLIANLDKEDVKEMIPVMEKYFLSHGISFSMFTYTGICDVPEVPQVDLAVVLGGDGTVLFSSKVLFSRQIPILGVNMGNVGFLTEVVREEWRDAFEKYQAGQLGISYRVMIKVSVLRKELLTATFIGLNDGVVSASGSSKIIYYDVNLSGVVLGEYRADGLIVATPTGSTAYSLAAGGPIVHPETEALILTPICPHSLSNRPVVIPGDEVVRVKISEKQRTDIALTIDGRDVFPLLPGDILTFEMMPHKTLLVRSDKRNFYEVVRAKLN